MRISEQGNSQQMREIVLATLGLRPLKCVNPVGLTVDDMAFSFFIKLTVGQEVDH